MSVPERDVEFLDDYRRPRSRTVAIHTAAAATCALEDEYALACEEWDDSEDESSWGRASADGLA